MPVIFEDAPEVVSTPFGKNQTVELEIHPDGPKMENPLLVQHKIGQLQRVGKHITQLEAKIYEDGVAGKGERLLRSDLSTEEFEQVNREIEQWTRYGNMRPLLLDYLTAAVKDWDMYASRADFEAGRKIPVSREAWARWSDDDLLTAFTKITDRYNMTDAEGKESSATLQDGSEMPTPLQESALDQSPDSSPSTQSQKSTAPAPAL